jgi:hypothetical protein
MYLQLKQTEILFSADNTFMCFVWIEEQTAFLYPYSAYLSVFVTEAECLLRGTNWVFKSDKISSLNG